MRTILALALTCALSAASLTAADAPAAILTVKNHKTFLAAVSRIAEAARPGMGAASAAMLPAFLGAPQLAGIDPDRPWLAAGWPRPGEGGGGAAMYVPVSDFAAFKAGLTPGILAGGQNEHTITEKDGYAVIFNPNSRGYTDEDRAKALGWKATPAKTDAAVHLHFAPDARLKEMMLGGFRAGREQALQGMMMGIKAAPNNASLDPETFEELMQLYFSFFDTALEGFKSIDIGISVADNDIVIHEQIAANDGTDLARWLAPNPDGVAADISAVDWNSTMAFAIALRGDETLSSFFEKAMILGFRMQGLKQDPEAAKETMKLMEDMLPLVTAGSMGFDKDGMTFGGYYRFPNRAPAKFHTALLDFMDSTIKNQVGDDKMYKSYDYEKGVRKIDGVSVDRLTMAYNLDNPLFTAPGQKEQMNAMFPGGKVTVEYAVADGKLFFTMGSAQMEKLLQQNKAAAAPPRQKVGSNTTFVGQMNLLHMVKGVVASLPASPIPPAVLDAIDPDGTGIRARVDQTGGLDVEVRVPLKIIETVSKAVMSAKIPAAN